MLFWSFLHGRGVVKQTSSAEIEPQAIALVVLRLCWKRVAVLLRSGAHRTCSLPQSSSTGEFPSRDSGRLEPGGLLGKMDEALKHRVFLSHVQDIEEVLVKKTTKELGSVADESH